MYQRVEKYYIKQKHEQFHSQKYFRLKAKIQMTRLQQSRSQFQSTLGRTKQSARPHKTKRSAADCPEKSMKGAKGDRVDWICLIERRRKGKGVGHSASDEGWGASAQGCKCVSGAGCVHPGLSGVRTASSVAALLQCGRPLAELISRRAAFGLGIGDKRRKSCRCSSSSCGGYTSRPRLQIRERDLFSQARLARSESIKSARARQEPEVAGIAIGRDAEWLKLCGFLVLADFFLNGDCRVFIFEVGVYSVWNLRVRVVKVDAEVWE